MVFNIFPIVFIVPIVAIILFYCQIQLQSPFSEPFSHIKRKIAHTWVFPFYWKIWKTNNYNLSVNNSSNNLQQQANYNLAICEQ